MQTCLVRYLYVDPQNARKQCHAYLNVVDTLSTLALHYTICFVCMAYWPLFVVAGMVAYVANTEAAYFSQKCMRQSCPRVLRPWLGVHRCNS